MTAVIEVDAARMAVAMQRWRATRPAPSGLGA